MDDINNKNNNIYLGLDVSTSCIGVCLLYDDGSEYGKIVELTHIKPKVSSKVKDVNEQLFVKKKIFEEFISKYKDMGITKVVIEEPLIQSNNAVTVSTLLRFNGMVSSCIYDILNIVPIYISSYDARKYSFPELMSPRKYHRDDEKYSKDKIINNVKKNKFVLFGEYPWCTDKKTILQQKVAKIFPEIPWLYDKSGELKKENYDAVDAYVACLGEIHKEKYGEPKFKALNINEREDFVEFEVTFWNNKIDRKIFF